MNWACKECGTINKYRNTCITCDPPSVKVTEKYQEPAPVRLSAEMLGEEDRAHLWNLRRLAMRYEMPMTGKLDPPCVVWADRLLGSADAKGGE